MKGDDEMIIKNNQKVYLFILILITVFVLGGCGGPSKKELANQYMEQVKPIVTEIGSMSNQWNDTRRKIGDGTISDMEVYLIIQNEFIPKINTLQEGMERIKVDKELRDVHELVIKMIAKQQQAFTEISSGLDAGDISKITRANQLLAEGRELERKYVTQLEDMRK